MAIKTSWYATDTALGINFNATYATVVAVPASVTSAISGFIDQAELFTANDLLGTTRIGTDGSQWILVKASTTVTQYNVIVYDDNYNANNMTTALALTGFNLAVGQFQNYLGQTVTVADPAVNPVFWAAIKGTGMQVQVSGSAGTGVAVNNGATPGSISVSATGTGLAGIAIYTSAGASGPVECNINLPRLRNIG